MKRTTVAILGAGFSGVGAAIKLKEAGITDFVILERASEVGGTWRDNRYPGVACDVPAHLYSFSFEPNPDWSHVYARGSEIQQYILHCVEKYDVRHHVQFGFEVNHMAFDEKQGRWRVSAADGQEVDAQFVLSCGGPLTTPAFPNIKGSGSFRGEFLHSARWPEGFAAEGKRIAVIGTGASAIQIVPEMAKTAANLTVVQRTAPWIMPRPDREIEEAKKQRFRRWPLLQWIVRYWIYLVMELYGPLVYYKDSLLKRQAEKLSLRYLRYKIKDPELREKCTPKYSFGCKRVLSSSDWYSSLTKSNVTLETQSIEEITEHGIRFTDGNQQEFDVIIFATGFHPPTAGSPFPILGLGGKSLNDVWCQGAYAYKGIAMSGFPNLFFVLGPNTGPGHTSVLVYVETQLRYICRGIQKVLASGKGVLNLRPVALQRYTNWLEKRMKKMVWTTGGCHSWYLTAEGKNSSLYPGPSTEYCLRARKFSMRDYELS